MDILVTFLLFFVSLPLSPFLFFGVFWVLGVFFRLLFSFTLFLFFSPHFLSPFSFSGHHTGLSIFFLCCIALPSYDWFLIPEAVFHTLSAPANLLLVLWCSFPFFLSPLPSLLAPSRVLLTLFANKVLSKQSSHGCWLSADRLTCEWAQNDESKKTETLINTQVISSLKKKRPI